MYCSSMYLFLLVCSMTHRPGDVAFTKGKPGRSGCPVGPRKLSKRPSLKQDLEAEVAMDPKKTSIAEHPEGNMGLNGGHLREQDH
ncbi:hypothetical protein Zmor_024175 [Zophobas morio]|uniref:Secreted protein n=1 Tax=Zophobas morio TaxID=2755281 RepID=A0AA38HZY4_9CUCU|nr:hypothetical protein Zmor_024175 [Zophobas morio]